MTADAATEGQGARRKFYASGYGTDWSLGGKYSYAIQVFKEHGVKNLLDIGCASGEFAVLCRNAIPDLSVSGVDIRQEAVDAARGKGVDAKIVDVDSSRLPFPDSSFDGIFCGEIIEHLFDPDTFVKEIYRLIRPSTGSRFCPAIFTTPNLASWYNRLFLLMGFQPLFTEVSTQKDFGHPFPFWLKAGHIRLFTLRALKSFFLYHGFCVIGVRGFGINTELGYGARWRIVASLANAVTRFMPSLSSDLVLTVVKKSN